MSHYDPAARQWAADIAGLMREYQANHSEADETILRTEAVMLYQSALQVEKLFTGDVLVTPALNQIVVYLETVLKSKEMRVTVDGEVIYRAAGYIARFLETRFGLGGGRATFAAAARKPSGTIIASVDDPLGRDKSGSIRGQRRRDGNPRRQGRAGNP